MSDSLRPYGLQHTRPPCLSPTPRVDLNSCPLSQWCHPTISSSVVPFSSCLQSFPANTWRSEVKSLSRVRLFVTQWTVAYQAPPSMGFSRQEYWSGLPFPSPGDLPDPGIKPGSPAFQADALTSEPPGKPWWGFCPSKYLGTPKNNTTNGETNTWVPLKYSTTDVGRRIRYEYHQVICLNSITIFSRISER